MSPLCGHFLSPLVFHSGWKVPAHLPASSLWHSKFLKCKHQSSVSVPPSLSWLSNPESLPVGKPSASLLTLVSSSFLLPVTAALLRQSSESHIWAKFWIRRALFIRGCTQTHTDREVCGIHSLTYIKKKHWQKKECEQNVGVKAAWRKQVSFNSQFFFSDWMMINLFITQTWKKIKTSCF